MKKDLRYPVEGECPFCKSYDVDFQPAIVDDAGVTYKCECQRCHATFNQCYDMIFAGNWDIRDARGVEYEDCPT